MKRFDRRSLLAGVVLGGMVAFTMAAGFGPRATPMEYQVVVGGMVDEHFERRLNEMGEWELVSVDFFENRSGMAVFRREK